jgi:hypothetical protein
MVSTAVYAVPARKVPVWVLLSAVFFQTLSTLVNSLCPVVVVALLAGCPVTGAAISGVRIVSDTATAGVTVIEVDPLEVLSV